MHFKINSQRSYILNDVFWTFVVFIANVQQAGKTAILVNQNTWLLYSNADLMWLLLIARCGLVVCCSGTLYVLL